MPTYTARRRTMTDEEVAAHYAASRCSEITAFHAGCSPATVLNIARRLGVPVNKPGKAGKALFAFAPGGHSRMTMEQVAEAYKAGQSGPEIAQAAGISHAAVYAALRRLGVPLRQSASEMVRAGSRAAAKRNEERKLAGLPKPFGFGRVNK